MPIVVPQKQAHLDETAARTAMAQARNAAALERQRRRVPSSLLSLLQSGNLASLLPLLGTGVLGTLNLQHPALGQVQGLEKILASLASAGITAQRATSPGVHPERYVVEFLSRLVQGGQPVMGRIMAPSLQRLPELGSNLLMQLGIPAATRSGGPGLGAARTVAGSAEEILGLLRALLSVPGGRP